ncbi:hypothetical protein G6F56_005807 [Rhizopus delemar]|nr:hypothetical protein G6F56_005807 [Rhizopus delemar]
MKPVTVLLLISSVCASLVPKVDFRFQKHIVFSSVGGGSSHNVWMLEVLKELHSRNHTVSFFSRGDHLSFADDYPMVKRYEVGGPLDFAIVAAMSNSLPDHPDPITTARVVIESSVGNYTQEFHHTRDLSEKLRIDMFVCDSFAIACIDAAITMKKPVMITSTFGFYKDLQAPYLNNKLHSGPYPTTAEESTWTRFYRDYILVPIMEYKLQFRLSETAKTQESLGFSFTVDSTSPRYNAISKMIHNVYGIESPKSLTPLDHYVGPIMRSSYPKLDNITQNFLDNHQRVVYVGFGQHAQAYKADLELILPSLLKLKKEGVIDGIIWARLSSEVPKDKDILLPGWAPQFAILQHPSISFFISHGGMASVVESLYNGVRLFVYPFFGDQPINARAIKQNGLVPEGCG